MEPIARDAKLEAVTELVKLAVKAAESGQWEASEQHLEEAAAAYQTVPAGAAGKDARYLGVGAAIAEGKGQLALRAGQLEEGVFHIEAAVKLRLEEEAAGGAPPPLSLPISLVNLTGACHRLGKLDDALRYNAMALERLGPMELPPARIFLAAAIEARANLYSQLARHAEALEAFNQASALAAQLAAAKLPGAPQLLTEIAVAHARAAARASDPLEAMRLSQFAADVAWERFERNAQGDRDALSHFVAAQMNLVSYAELAGRYAQGEDALFKVLRLVGPDPRVVARGKAFYEALQKLDDAQLDAGNLPRDEVEESLGQLLRIATPRPTASA
jgi:tetratricopeptide (TPR) repeat protein